VGLTAATQDAITTQRHAAAEHEALETPQPTKANAED
jgi:hypothetical protein